MGKQRVQVMRPRDTGESSLRWEDDCQGLPGLCPRSLPSADRTAPVKRHRRHHETVGSAIVATMESMPVCIVRMIKKAWWQRPSSDQDRVEMG